MEPIQKNQLLLFAVLSVLTSTVAYTSSQRELLSSSAERCNDQKVVCFISAANGNFNYGALQTGWCTHYILIDLIVVNSEAKLLVIEESIPGKLSSGRRLEIKLSWNSMIPALTLLTEVKGRIRQMGDQAKFILAIGGINQDSSHFSQAVEDLGRSQRLAESIVDYAHKYCFDGVDLAWFYPGSFGGCGADKTNLIVLLHKLRCLLQDTVSLSLTVGVDPQFEFRYNISLVNSYVDFVNIMSGDYHDPEQLSHVSPLYPGNANDRFNVVSSVSSMVGVA